MSDELVTLSLSRLHLGQILSGLSVLVEDWDNTTKYLESEEKTGFDFAIRECSKPTESRWIADFYREIITAIEDQLPKIVK